ncbi:MAG: hypothetical protein JNL38_05345 [Myxococcales bacterium]|nr:hypothetical protein [Myxococcales bacterium]
MGAGTRLSRVLQWAFFSASVAVVVGMVVAVLGNGLAEWRTWGGHDWDQMEAHRYLVVKTIKRFGQFPFWDPYGCGGHPSWAGIESGTTIVSPFAPLYLFLKLSWAMRIEVLGCALGSAGGAWLLAGRYTRSHALKAFVCVLFAVGPRWAYQASAGHTWHMYYALTPWVFWAFDVATTGDRPHLPKLDLRWAALAGAFLALMVYCGGIYPLPQTALLLGVVALVRAGSQRSIRPLVAVAVTGALSVAFSAAKLFPIMDTLRRYPRIIESNEVLDFSSLLGIFVTAEPDIPKYPFSVPRWGFHEYGTYVGWAAFVAVVVGVLFARAEPRARAMRVAGVFAIVLAVGAFHKYAPWALLRELPIFKSQHVPSRWTYPGLLLLATVAASTFEGWLRRAGRLRPAAEVAILAAVVWIAKDIGTESHRIMAHAFGVEPPRVAEKTGGFVTHLEVPPELTYPGSWAPPAMPVRIANQGQLNCITFPGLNPWAPHDASGRVKFMGARGKTEPDYRGEVFLESGQGAAGFERWSPNEMVVHYSGARPGDHVVVNQNWDESWRVDGAPTVNLGWKNAVRVSSSDGTVTFRYVPRTFALGATLSLGSAALVVGLIARGALRRRRARGVARAAAAA